MFVMLRITLSITKSPSLATHTDRGSTELSGHNGLPRSASPRSREQTRNS
jgi:hypothetical protein